jgi:TRAP-type C4-dicarboxylate transport system permease small subunit
MFIKLEKLTKDIGVGCVAILFMLMTIQVILRYGFGYTHFFTEELGRYLLVWATLAGMAIETRQGGHIRVNFLAERLPASWRRAWFFILDIVLFLLFLLLVYTGVDSTVFNHGQQSAAMQLPLSIPFLAIPVFFAIAAVFMLEKICSCWKSRK